MTRTMVCPYCGYTCQLGGIGAAYCGPHSDSDGQNFCPAVRMEEKQHMKATQQLANLKAAFVENDIPWPDALSRPDSPDAEKVKG